MTNKVFTKNNRNKIIVGALLLVFLLFYLGLGTVGKGLSQGFYRSCGILTVILIIGILAGYYLYSFRKLALHWLFVIYGAVFGLFFMMLVPIYSVPDEEVHIASAYAISNALMGVNDDPSDGVAMRADDNAFNKQNQQFTIEDYERIFNSVFTGVNDTTMSDSPYKPVDAPLYQYVIPGLGMTIGRILGFGTVGMLLMGRLFNLIFYLLAVAFAIKLISRGKMIIFAVALMPMSLQQAASYSYDVFINAAVLLMMALLVRIMSKNEDASIAELICLGITSLLLLPSKHYAYFLICFLPLMLIFKKNISKRNRRIIIGIVAALALIVLFGKFVSFGGDHAMATGSNIISWAGEEGYTIGYLLKNPKEIVRVFYVTLRSNLAWYINSMIGDSFGWLEVEGPKISVYLMMFALLFSTFDTQNEEESFSVKNKLWLTLVAVITVAFVFAGLLFSWTPISSASILGVQGRYFIPVLPIVLFVLKTKRIKATAELDNLNIVIIAVANFIVCQNFIFRL